MKSNNKLLLGLFLIGVVATAIYDIGPKDRTNTLISVLDIENAQAASIQVHETDLCGLDDVICEGEQEKPLKYNSVEELIRAKAKEYGVDVQTALDIGWCESHWNPLAENNSNTNGSNDKGLFQINSIHGLPDTCRLDANCNVEWAMKKMQAEGFWAWYSSESCWNK